MNESLYIVMPAYNEEDNIEETVRAWYPVVEKFNGNGKSRLVIFNDGSKDRTYEIGKRLEKDFPLFKIIDKSNSGHGATLIQAYKYVIAEGGTYVFQTDSDGQTNPSEFEKFWNEREKYDGIFGARTVRGDGRSRAFVEKVVCILLKFIFGVNVPDANAPFRLMRTEVLEKYLQKLPDEYNLPNIMLTTYFVYYKEKVEFKEITFKPRTAGKNSIDLNKIIRIGWKAVGDFIVLKRKM